MSKRRLGKGIDALLGGQTAAEGSPEAGSRETGTTPGLPAEAIVTLPLDRVKPNPDQPRKSFSAEALEDLAASIREKGVIQPIVVEAQGDEGYQIVAGERRYRAAKLVGLPEVPAILRSFTEAEKLEIALIENLQREDLNPIEEAQAFAGLIKEHSWTQEELAKRLGMSRTAIANSIRLLKLSDGIQDKVARGALSAGHARALLSLDNKGAREALAQRIEDEGLSVRETEALSAGRPLPALKGTGESEGEEQGTVPDKTKAKDKGGSGSREGTGEGEGTGGDGSKLSPEALDMEDKLMKLLGTNVKLVGTDNKGQLRIDYYSMDELSRLYQAIQDGMSRDLAL